MAVIKRSLVIGAILLYLEMVAHARIKTLLVYTMINQAGQGGKQVYDGSGDQSLTVHEPVLYMEDQISSRTKLNLNFTLDTFSGASDAIFDTATGASGGAPAANTNPGHGITDEDEDDPASASTSAPQRKWENRQAFDISLAQKAGAWVLIPTFGASTQQDYHSNHSGVSLQRSLVEDNFMLSAGVMHYDDQVNLFDLPTTTFTGWAPRVTDTYDISISQILSPDDVVLFGSGFTRQSGHLSTDRNSEALTGARVAEVLPDKRNKNTYTIRLIHGINDYLAVHLDYRYYTDDWGIYANTYEPSLAFALGERQQGLIRLLYRYYSQNGSAYYKDNFTVRLPYMTSDSDLARFDSRELGLQCTYSIDVNMMFSEIEFGGGIIYYNRSNDLSAVLYQLSLGGTF